VVDANALTAAQKLKVAQRVGLSETAFVSASDSATIKLDFFTPTRQIAHCGHDHHCHLFTLAVNLESSAKVVFPKKRLMATETSSWTVAWRLWSNVPQSTHQILSTSELGRRAIASLRLTQAQLLTGIDPFVVNTGNSFLIVPLPDERSVAELRPDLGPIASLSDELDLIGYYVFSTATRVPGRHAGARMFAPRFGIPEEAGTGMAAGPLACFLHDHLGVQDREIFIEQGWLMQPPSPSVIKVTLELAQGKISRLMAGGTARAVSSMQVEV
jgi:PhzF family phenazine biosynthesis protein